MTKKQRAGGDKRGSAQDRRRRKLWMLETFGDGATCPCAWCKTPLALAEVEADRLDAGGSYGRENVVPACRNCNADRGNESAFRFARRIGVEMPASWSWAERRLIAAMTEGAVCPS